MKQSLNAFLLTVLLITLCPQILRGQAELILEFNTTNTGVTNSNSIRFPAVFPSFYDIDVGNNGTFELLDVSGSIDIDITSTAFNGGAGYPAGTIQIAVRNAISGGGNFQSLQFGFGSDALKLTSIVQWGSSIVWTSMNNAFNGCANMTMAATDTPDVSGVTDFANAFASCDNFNGNLNGWDVSSGTTFARMFEFSPMFNGDISGWNVGNGVLFQLMFNGATAFNQNIGGWNVSSGTNFTNMFTGSSFNQNLNSWIVSSGILFRGMFSQTPFNGDVSNWDVSSGTDFTGMFGLTPFNQDISGWNVSNGTLFENMFLLCSAFNQDLSSWIVSSGTNFRQMFRGATVFNGDISSWNVSSGTIFTGMFRDTPLFNQDISGWDVSSGTDFFEMFDNATAFNQDISGWNVSSGTNFAEMFIDATAFNQDLGGWNVGAMTDGTDMLSNSGLSVANWDATLVGWNAQSFTNPNITVGATGLEYCAGKFARTNMQGTVFTFSGDTELAGASCDTTDYLILTYNTTNTGPTDNNSLRFPAIGGTYDVDVNNDGTFELLDQSGIIDIDVTSAAFNGGAGYTAGTIEIAVRNAISGSGNFETLKFTNIFTDNDREKLTQIDQWGADIVWTSMGSAFDQCSNMTLAATDTPDVSGVTDFSFAFRGCSLFNGNLNLWDVSSGTNFAQMFADASLFNGNITGWNVSSGTNFSGMFLRASAFNQDIGGWNVSSGTNFAQMFGFASAFNQDLNLWNVSSGTSFAFMFDNTTVFNGNITNWDVSNGTNFSLMFRNTPVFNQDISGWNVSSGTNFSQMFIQANSFNQDISSWDVSSGTNFSLMFFSADLFDQNLGSWNVGAMTDGTNMLSNSGLSVANWDATLIGWNAQSFSNPNVTVGATGLQYCAATNQRQNMINNSIFQFTGDTQQASCPVNNVIISQIYENGGNTAIELTNISGSTINGGTINLALFSDTSGDQTGVSPSATYTVAGNLLANQSVLIESVGFTGANIINSPIEEVNASITGFSGGNDIITLSTSTDNTAWTLRYEVIESFINNTSYVRNDNSSLNSTSFNASEWTIFVDDALNPYRDEVSGGPERHPHDALISEVNTSAANSNMGLGYHRTGSTSRTGSVWSNGTPDRSRNVSIDEDYHHTGSSLSARQLTVNNRLSLTDNLLIVSESIGINNEIRLVGNSQLITTHTGSTEITGSGTLSVDQNSDVPSLYRYNYFGSPVNSTGLSSYTVADVLKDGSAPLDATSTIGNSATDIAKDITFIGGYDGDGTTDPISLAEHWVYSYNSGAWVQQLSAGTLGQADGFIFKGPGQVQNYTFVGTPKDGTLQTIVGADASYLVGNPYASAIRASKFIEDNLSAITGTLYFWEQKESANGETDNSGHNYAGYVGGYAIRNLTMGIAANNVTGNDASTGASGLGNGPYKEPAPYIAIGQGFFIGGSDIGGTVEFNNSQREYILEGSQSVFFRGANRQESTESNGYGDLAALKLGMDYSAQNEELELHRQIGISFTEGRSFDFEKGYDSESFDLGVTDIYWDFPEDNTPYLIAGVGVITDDMQVPLTILMGYQGDIKLRIDEIGNIDREVYLLDQATGVSYELSGEALILTLSPGDHKDRFFLTFGDATLSLPNDDLLQETLQLFVDQSEHELVIEYDASDLILNTLTLYDLLGKKLQVWTKLDNEPKTEQLRLKIRKLPRGIYVIKLKTQKGIINKKSYLDFF